MRIIYGKAGGLVAIGKRYTFCVFPANTWFALGKWLVVIFRVGFFIHPTYDEDKR